MWLLVLLTLGQTSTTTTVQAHSHHFQGFFVGETITLDAHVFASTFGFGFHRPRPTGSVDFVMDSSVDLGSANLGFHGEAKLFTTLIPVGTHTIVATYSGDANFATSTSATITITVNPAITHTSLSPSHRTFVLVNSTTTFTAFVSRGWGCGWNGQGTPVPDGGVVTFFVDGVAQTPTTTTSGVATFTYTAPAAPATDTVYATYAGDSDDAPSTSRTTFVHVVNSLPSHSHSFWFFH